MGVASPAVGEFGQLLLSLRSRARLTQEELSHATGVSLRALADLERGRSRGPQRRTVRALAEGLGLDAADTEKLERAAQAGRPRRRSAAPTAHHGLALPRDIEDFTAREAALAKLRALAGKTDLVRPTVALISGPPGLGKTSFGVRAAHALAPHFPDGQFALDLHGMDPEPTTPRDALARLLRAVGVAESAIPGGVDDRSGLFRSIVRDRRLLLLLDNAAHEDQVRPLLPGNGGSLTIVTSRHALAGLESVHRIELALLRREEAVELLTRIIGAERVQQETQAARDLAELCGHLPLAVRIAGQRLAGRPHERVSKLVAQLADEERRLDALQAGGLRVRAAFALSYRQLAPATRTLLRRAALAAGPDFSPESAALLADLPIRQAALCAEELVDAGLLLPRPTVERYQFHDLLKLFAAEQLAVEDGTEACDAAQDRAARWMLRRATAAALRFDADRHQDPPGGDPDPASAPASREKAREWLEAERAQWLAALRRAQATGWHQQVIDMAEAMHWFSDLNQHWELWVEVFRRAVDAARALGSRHNEAVHLNYLAWAYNICVYDHHAALEAADTALVVAREIDDQLQMGWALAYGAAALHRIGRVDESIGRLQDAAACLSGQTSLQGRLAELSTLNTLGNYLRQRGCAEDALTIHRRSEASCRAGMPGLSPELIALYLAVAWQCLGNDLAALGRWTDAEAMLRQALAGFEAANMLAWSEPARLDLGLVLRRLARYDEAREVLLTARDTLGELNSPRRVEAAAELRELDRLTVGA
ncbi:helix-turn-helix domain-containing protein [Micromonospora eburnea]|uniref:Tetratricopeptide repeat-containing protein n=1 Tax=Micromonospora eburnea TaxID=227316 RepID=A0A1C6TYL5_9ACTN|nr:helix-turn-helix domain-containing protein [Micromonospora eburnea]SCL46847.1 Tetratricopeptide repeat-containing protein [Micromonospora eburnea]